MSVFESAEWENTMKEATCTPLVCKTLALQEELSAAGDCNLQEAMNQLLEALTCSKHFVNGADGL